MDDHRATSCKTDELHKMMQALVVVACGAAARLYLRFNAASRPCEMAREPTVSKFTGQVVVPLFVKQTVTWGGHHHASTASAATNRNACSPMLTCKLVIFLCEIVLRSL